MKRTEFLAMIGGALLGIKLPHSPTPTKVEQARRHFALRDGETLTYYVIKPSALEAISEKTWKQWKEKLPVDSTPIAYFQWGEK